MKTIAIIESLDTKLEESVFARDLINEQGFHTLLIDNSTWNMDVGLGDISPLEVLAENGMDRETFLTFNKPEKIAAMAEALKVLLLRLYHASEQGTSIVYIALTIAAVGMPLLWCDAFIPAMTLRIVNDSVYVSAVSVLALLAGRCALGYVLTIPLGLGVPGLWIALVAEWLFRAAALRIRSRRWSESAAA